MAFFAVVRNFEDSFEIMQCHINLWCLGGIFGHSNFVWDVGLRLKGLSEKPITKIQLALPFGTTEGAAEDLQSRLIHPHTAELVFGNPVTIAGSEIVYDERPVVLGKVDSFSRLQDKCGMDFSFWELGLAPTLANENEVYLRVRFRMGNRGNTWVWRRSLWRKNGALLDLRVSDVREAVAIRSWEALKERIVPVERLNLLVIAPDFLQMRAVSPSLRYMRLLESRAWENYLGQSPNISGQRRLIIYHWKNDKPVNVNTPFLAFIDLSRDYGFIRAENHVRSAAVIILLAVILTAYGREIGGALWMQIARLAGQNKLASALGSAGLFALVIGAYRNWPLARSVVAVSAAGFLSIERFFLKAKRR
jgi:hypothetical protein